MPANDFSLDPSAQEVASEAFAVPNGTTVVERSVNGSSRDVPANPFSLAACPVCDTERQDAYCTACGHAYQDERLTLRRLTVTGFRRVFDLDSGLLHTFWQLIRDPARVAQNYSAGIRKPYVNPFTYFILAAALQLLGYTFAQPAVIDATAELFESNPESVALYVELWGEEAPARYVAVTSGVMQQAYTWITFCFFAVPLAITLRLLMGGKNMNLAEAGVFSTYATAQMLFATFPLLLVITVGRDLTTHQFLVYPTMIGWIGYAVYRYFGGSVRTVLLGGLAVVLSFVSFIVMMTLVLVGMVIAEVGIERFLEAAKVSATI